MNSQEVLNKVYLAVRAQGAPSKSPTGRCAYRGEGGTKCAAGHLIDDVHYTPRLEGKSATFPDVVAALRASGVDPDCIWGLVNDLQLAHDGVTGIRDDYETDFVAHWDKEASTLAARYGLTLPKVPT